LTVVLGHRISWTVSSVPSAGTRCGGIRSLTDQNGQASSLI